MSESQFAPLKYVDGYLPIEDFGLIGDGNTAALVARDGSVAWLCAPRFDSQPIFSSILDANQGGAFILAPEGLRASRQYYEDDTAVLVTELRCDSGTVRYTDLLALKHQADLSEDTRLDRSEFLRLVEVLDGEVRLRLDVNPAGGCDVSNVGDGFEIACRRSDLRLILTSSVQLERMPMTVSLSAGDKADFCLSWAEGTRRLRPYSALNVIEQTRSSWRRWMEAFAYDGPEAALVRRSCITIKLVDYVPNGAILAAPTSSLPEDIGGVRNWDYRYAWIRDAAFAVYALRRVGYPREAEAFLGWVLDATEKGSRPSVLYTIDGVLPDDEYEDPRLEGYRRSKPVRWGNGAATQRQHDVYGEVLDCAYQWVDGGGQITEHLWGRLTDMIEGASSEWHQPDHGIWEVRTEGEVYTYSAALCQVALDRGIRLAQTLGLPGDIEKWRRESDRIKQAILSEGWNEQKQAITQAFNGESLDAGVLSLPLRQVIAHDDPRMVATTEAISRELGVGNGLLLRYIPEQSPDGLPGDEGAFLLCSFWLVDNLAGQGRLDEAQELYHSLCARAGPLGLLPEQIDPDTGVFLGNYPQAFSHIGVISSGVNLARKLNGRK